MSSDLGTAAISSTLVLAGRSFFVSVGRIVVVRFPL